MKSAVDYFDVKTDKLDEFKDAWDGIAKKLHSEKGWLGCALLSEPGSGKCVGVGLWESEEIATNFATTDRFKEYMSELRPFLTSDPQRGIYDFQADMPEENEEEERRAA